MVNQLLALLYPSSTNNVLSTAGLTLDTERGLVLLDPALGAVPGAAVVDPRVLPVNAGHHELTGDQPQPSLHPDLHRELVLHRGDVLPVLLPPDAHLV